MADPTPAIDPITVTAKAPGPRTTGIKTFKPAISVILAKNIGRSTVGDDVGVSERFAGANRAIDLTPYLGDAGMVVVSRSTRQPAGMWSVTLSDKMEPDQEESLYGLIEPLDVIQISMARDQSKYTGQAVNSMPVVMRGFVSDVRRVTEMTESGPRRSIVISGQDYGKILQIMRIQYLPGYVLGQDLLTPYNLFLNYGVEAKGDQTGTEFIQSVLDHVVTPFIDGMIASTGYSGPSRSPVTKITLDSSVTKGIVSPFGSQSFDGGTTYELMRYFGDVGPWNELYVEDRSDGPYLVYRPTPFKDLKGSMIQGGTSPTSHDVRDDEIVELSVERSDADVGNYYWVASPRYSLIDNAQLQRAAIGGLTPPAAQDKYPNCSPNLYGVRLMEVETQQGARVDGQDAGTVTSGTSDAMAFLDDRRTTLIANNRDNIVLEAGSITIRGNEAIGHGDYINLVRGPGTEGSFEAEYYAHTVTHQFQPMRSFMTTIQFDRGMGFAKRLQRGRGVNSPYLAELNLSGAYDG